MSFQQLHIGLTGGIATGKSTIGKALRRLKIPVFSSDKAVHQVLKENKSVIKAIGERLPETIATEGVDRQALGRAVFQDESDLRWLEDLLHPEVTPLRRAYFEAYPRAGFVVSEIPLLFETGMERLCDKTVAVVCSEDKQRQRALKRPGMTAEKLDGILKRQLSMAEKTNRADYVITTDGSKRETVRHLTQLIRGCS